MSRALLVLANDEVRNRAINWVRKAPTGTRVEFREQKRSTDQNSRLWAILTDIAAQKEHCGRKYPPEIWKTLFMAALGREMQFVPTLDGSSFMPLGYRSSELSKAEFSELLEFIQCWCAENGVLLHDSQEVAA